MILKGLIALFIVLAVLGAILDLSSACERGRQARGAAVSGTAQPDLPAASELDDSPASPPIPELTF